MEYLHVPSCYFELFVEYIENIYIERRIQHTESIMIINDICICRKDPKVLTHTTFPSYSLKFEMKQEQNGSRYSLYFAYIPNLIKNK